MHSIVLALCSFLAFSGCATAARMPSSSAHFVEDNGKAWPELEPIWEKLAAFYGTAMPDQVTIVFTDAGASRFDTVHNRILLDRRNFKERRELLVAHETSHLCLNVLTQGASSTEPFRFLDEGFAEIISRRIAGALERYKNEDSLPTAALQLKKDNVSFAKVQKWSEYFGGPNAGRWYAYEVGASFDFFVMDQYGELKLKDLFLATGESKDLDLSLKKALGKPAAAIESEWKAYLSKVPLSSETPRIIEFFPANDAEGVAPDLAEAYVRFSLPMNTGTLVVVSDCDGLCYTNSYWKTSTTLAIRTPDRLKSGFVYQAQLGKADKPLLSRSGIPLPVTKWRFKTR